MEKMPFFIHLGDITRSLYSIGFREHLQCPTQTGDFSNVIELQDTSFVWKHSHDNRAEVVITW